MLSNNNTNVALLFTPAFGGAPLYLGFSLGTAGLSTKYYRAGPRAVVVWGPPSPSLDEIDISAVDEASVVGSQEDNKTQPADANQAAASALREVERAAVHAGTLSTVKVEDGRNHSSNMSMHSPEEASTLGNADEKTAAASPDALKLSTVTVPAHLETEKADLKETKMENPFSYHFVLFPPHPIFSAPPPIDRPAFSWLAPRPTRPARRSPWVHDAPLSLLPKPKASVPASASHKKKKASTKSRRLPLSNLAAVPSSITTESITPAPATPSPQWPTIEESLPQKHDSQTGIVSPPSPHISAVVTPPLEALVLNYDEASAPSQTPLFILGFTFVALGCFAFSIFTPFVALASITFDFIVSFALSILNIALALPIFFLALDTVRYCSVGFIRNSSLRLLRLAQPFIDSIIVAFGYFAFDLLLSFGLSLVDILLGLAIFVVIIDIVKLWNCPSVDEFSLHPPTFGPSITPSGSQLF
ncbi:hypothetical protein C8F01DRAFT_1154837 [Mycena amicta]|nr:hypothetical protein C8F01DRAFT_1154837 [Mycena amicta]